MNFLFILFTFNLFVVVISSYCTPYDPSGCWPNENDINKLKLLLKSSIVRQLYYNPNNQPYSCAIPINSPNNQPLYGDNIYLDSIYINKKFNYSCFINKTEKPSEICLQSVRNNPLELYQPAFVMWPLNALHIQYIIKFANQHNLCTIAIGPGHDFLNRNICGNYGIMIRTSLLKNITFLSNNQYVQLGAGLVFAEVFNALINKKKHIACGWASTVGIVGWSLGGGHGPFGASAGLGVDNIVDATIVISNGDIITVNETNQYSDLYKALLGGGGGTWGIITQLTLKTHSSPINGYTFGRIIYVGDFCNDKNSLNLIIDNMLLWMKELDYKWSGLMWTIPLFNETLSCKRQWAILIQYTFLGDKSNKEFNITWNKILKFPATKYVSKIVSYSNWYDYVKDDLEYIIPIPYLVPKTNQSVGGVPSILMSRENISIFGNLMKQTINQEKWNNRIEIYHDLTGNINSKQPNNTSLSPGMRSSIFHVVLGEMSAYELDVYYSIAPYSYFSESAYIMNDWKTRYWYNQYEDLLKVKLKYDPHYRFKCRHCIGDDEN